MADTQRTKTDLLTNLFQDGQAAGSISANDVRDLIVSVTPDYGGCYFTTPAATSISVATTYYKAAGTTTLTSASATVDMPASNRLRFLGVAPRHFHVVMQASVELAAGQNQDIGLQLWKYDNSGASGALIAHSEARTTISNTAVVQITSHADVMLDTNDYIEIHIANHSGTNNITAEFGYLFAVSMLM